MGGGSHTVKEAAACEVEEREGGGVGGDPVRRQRRNRLGSDEKDEGMRGDRRGGGLVGLVGGWAGGGGSW